MVGANKILTVSYGTFSCTLEGFDEPFNTMKAIAEYFRDLAADDRYFGAEPPQPDAEMLHRIAEREIQRRVEAKIQENGVILRQQDTLLGAQPEADETPEANEPDALVAEAPAEAVAAPEFEPAPEPEIIPEPVAAPAPVQLEEVAEEPAADSVAAKLQRIREAVARARAAQAEAMMEEDEPVSEPVAFLSETDADASAEAEDFGYELDISGPFHEDEMEAETVSEEPVAVEEAVAPELATEHSEVETAEVETAEADLDDEDDEAEEDDLAEADSAEGERRQATRRARRSAKRAKRIAALKAAAEAEIASAESEEVDAPALIEEPVAETVEPEIDVAEIEVAVAEDAAEEIEAPAEAPVEATLDETIEIEADAEPVAEEMAPEEMAGEELAGEPEQVEEETPAAPEAPALRARVIKVRRREAIEATAIVTEEATAQDETVETAEDDDDLSARLAAELGTEAPAPQPETEATGSGALSPELEADLMRELAALELDDEPVADAIENAEADEAATQDVAAAPEVEMPEVDLSALMLEAEDEVPAPEAEAEPVSEELVAPATADLAVQDVLILGNAIIEPAEETSEDVTSEDLSETVALDEAADEAEAIELEMDEAEEFAEDEEFAAEFEDDFDDEGEDAQAETEAAEIAARETVLPPLPAADRDAEMDRLLAEADKQAEGVETRRRFSAIAHLKAAVAATVADRLTRGQDTATGGAADEDDGSEPYRADLTQAVRPRRPSSSGETNDRRPEPMRPAPLVLVSEQRVDESRAADEEAPAPAAAASIRPRRVSAAQIAAAEDAEIAPIDPQKATSFAEFAESLGTQGLSDLLEAAAAYTAAVEGRPHFSPPQIMRKLAAMDETADVPREERMRVFGRLLRQGKITKVKRGQYAITEASRYWDEAKIASGQ